jgi:hypothetical protein
MMSSRYVLTRWEPEQPAFWRSQGKRIAQRNLWISIPALMLAFSIWMLWSVVVVNSEQGGIQLKQESDVLANNFAGAVGRHSSNLLFLSDVDFRWPQMDGDFNRQFAVTRLWHGVRVT